MAVDYTMSATPTHITFGFGPLLSKSGIHAITHQKTIEIPQELAEKIVEVLQGVDVHKLCGLDKTKPLGEQLTKTHK